MDEGFNSFIGVPIYAADKIIGVMNILSYPPDILGEYDIELCKAIGSHVGLAIRNAQLFAELKQAKKVAENANQVKSEFLQAMLWGVYLKVHCLIFSCRINMAKITLNSYQNLWYPHWNRAYIQNISELCSS